jgi:hypothetical protein
MRIKVRGWGRDQGEKVLMDAALSDAGAPENNTYSVGSTYLQIDYKDSPRWRQARVTTSANLRLGGRYLLQVELSRYEIAQLFFATHSGEMVRMIQSFILEEEREDNERHLARLAAMDERRRQRRGQAQSDEHGGADQPKA